MLSERLPILVRLTILAILTIIVLLLPRGWAQSNGALEQTAAPYLANVSSVQDGLIAVGYEDGQLTISAHNAPLLDVLRRVCQQIGAELESPEGASERLFVNVGPGPTREILASLLAGSQFNYAMQASENDPNLLARLVVMSKTEASPQQASMNSSEVPSPAANGSKAKPNAADVAATKIDPATAKQEAQQLRDFVAETKKQIASLVAADPEAQSTGTVNPNEAGMFGIIEAALKVAETAGADVNPQALSAAITDSLPTQPHRHRH